MSTIGGTQSEEFTTETAAPPGSEPGLLISDSWTYASAIAVAAQTRPMASSSQPMRLRGCVARDQAARPQGRW